MKKRTETKGAPRARAVPSQADPELVADVKKGFLIDGRFECLESVIRPEPGESFAAVDNQSGQEVIVRIIQGQAPDDQQQKTFFERIERLVGMTSKNVEKVIDAGLTGESHPFVVTGRIDGQTITSLLAEGQPVSIGTACDISRQIANALVEADHAGCVHSHLSTSTVILLPGDGSARHEFKVKVIGFTPWELTESNKSDHAFAPEVILGAKPDVRSDCYSLGVILYTLVCNEAPFTGVTKEAISLSHLNDKVGLPSKVCPDRNVPPALDNLLLRLLEKNPDKRQSSPEQILVHLESIHNSVNAIKEVPAEGATVVRQDLESHSFIDEGISFASGERISTTDFPAISLSDVMTKAGKTKKMGQVVQEKMPDFAEIPAVEMIAPQPTTQVINAAIHPSGGRGIPPILLGIAIILVIGLVAMSGWYLLDQNAALKHIIEASQNMPASVQKTTQPVVTAPQPATAVKVPEVAAPVSAPAPAPVPADTGSLQKAVITQAAPEKAAAAVKEPAIISNKPVATKKVEAAKAPEPAIKVTRPQPQKLEVPAIKQAAPTEIQPPKPAQKAKVDWNSGLDDSAPAAKKVAPTPTPDPKKVKASGTKGSGDKTAPETKKPSLNWDE